MSSNRALKPFRFLGLRRNVATNAEIVETPSAPANEMVVETVPEGISGEALEMFEQDVLRIVKRLSSDMDQVQNQSVQATEQLGGVHGSIQTLVGSSQQVREEISGIAHATEEMSAAVNEISATVVEVQQRTGLTMESAVHSATEIESLGSAVAEIGALLNSIAEIATRTNLLALNATIEAARAGEAGRGFAVVAGEVKALSVAAAQSVTAIRARMTALQAASDGAITGMRRIRDEIGEITPICAAITQATEEQRSTLSDLSGRMQGAQSAVSSLASAVGSINEMTTNARTVSEEARRRGAAASQEASDLGRRVVTILRTIPAINRRKHDRYPVDLAMRIRVGAEMVPARTFDVSLGGVLIKSGEKVSLAVGTSYEAEISNVGHVRMRVVGTSPNGTHCAFEKPGDDVLAAVGKVIDRFQMEHAPLIARAITFAEDLRVAVEADVEARKLSFAAIFDTDYQPIAGTDPVQLSTRYLERIDQLFPPIFERTLQMDPNMVFCLAIDRNGYIPVHNQKFSQPQRKGDPAWNATNARNRRIFDDRAGLIAGRLQRPSLVQTYNRDMGNGVFVPMKEIDAPLVFLGRHWGGVRMAYRL